MLKNRMSIQGKYNNMVDFEVVTTEKNKKFLRIKNDIVNIQTLKECLIKNRINHVVISENISSLSFCSEIRDFVEILVCVHKIKCDFSGIESLYKLKHLYIEDFNNQKIDFRFLSNVEYLNIKWNKKIYNLQYMYRLEHVKIRGYANKNFKEFLLPDSIVKFEVISSSAESLLGIEKLSNLIFLGISNFNNLKNLNGINTLNNLEVLEISNCKNINNIDSIKELTKVREIVLENSGEISSIEFFKDLNKLENVRLLGKTNILDGEVSFIKKLPFYYIEPKKHYH